MVDRWDDEKNKHEHDFCIFPMLIISWRNRKEDDNFKEIMQLRGGEIEKMLSGHSLS